MEQIVNGHNLKILGLVASDRGVYQCLASNSVGNIQAAAQLTILPSGKSVPVASAFGCCSHHFDHHHSIDLLHARKPS